MKIPTIGNVRLVDEKGYPTTQMQAWMSQLQTNMNKSLSDEGLEIPQQSTQNINYINSQTEQNMIWYDKDSSAYKVNVDGEIKTVNVS